MDSGLFKPNVARVLVSWERLEEISRCVTHTTIKHGRIEAVVWHEGERYACTGLSSFRGLEVATCDRLCRLKEWPYPTRTYYQDRLGGLDGFWAGILVQDRDGTQWVISSERVAFYYERNKQPLPVIEARPVVEQLSLFGAH